MLYLRDPEIGATVRRLLTLLLALAAAGPLNPAPPAASIAVADDWVPPPWDDDDPPFPAGDWFDGEIICANLEYHVRYHAVSKTFWMWVYNSTVLVSYTSWTQPPFVSPLTIPSFNLYLANLAASLEGELGTDCSVGFHSGQVSLFDGSWDPVAGARPPAGALARATYGKGRSALHVLAEPTDGGAATRMWLEFQAPGAATRSLELDESCDAACVDAFLATLPGKLIQSIRRTLLEDDLALVTLVAAGAAD